MFLPFFGRKPRLTEAQRGRLQALEGSDSAELAAELLRGPTALLQLTLPEARQVVSYMLPMRIPEGNTFIRQGDRQSTDFMVLVLEGEVTVDTIVVSRTQPMVVNVLGKGSLIGEMGLLDGEPRAASCTASSPLTCAILTRRALEELLIDDPQTTAKLMLAVSIRIAQRMRDTSDKLKRYAQLTQTMQHEINRLLPS
ncbi:MAG: cyclic nucleotide-binding domain-containing protein [Pseudomonadota bacterium]